MACGTPVAAYPVTGALDVSEHSVTGVMDDNLADAIGKALTLDRDVCRSDALEQGRAVTARQFRHALVPVNADKVAALKAAQWETQPMPALGRAPLRPKVDRCSPR